MIMSGAAFFHLIFTTLIHHLLFFHVRAVLLLVSFHTDEGHGTCGASRFETVFTLFHYALLDEWRVNTFHIDSSHDYLLVADGLRLIFRFI